MRTLVVALVACLSLLAPVAARADDYVCMVKYNPSVALKDQYGSLDFATSYSPTCAFPWTPSTLCSTGGDPSVCSNYKYSELGMMGMYQALVQAMINRLKVEVGYQGDNKAATVLIRE